MQRPYVAVAQRRPMVSVSPLFAGVWGCEEERIFHDRASSPRTRGLGSPGGRGSRSISRPDELDRLHIFALFAPAPTSLLAILAAGEVRLRVLVPTMPKPYSPRALPPLPGIKLSIDKDRSEHAPARAYLTIRRLELRAQFPDGSVSEPFFYDLVERKALDAVVVAPHFRDEGGTRKVLLRSALRPPVVFRPRSAWPMPERETLGGLWEFPAGLVEPSERSEEGLRQCAARELYEETGAEVAASAMLPLGPSVFPCPGVIGERHFYFHAEIDPGALVPPIEDGSVLERQATLVTVTLQDALDLVRAGEIEDAKTELALRRLAEI
jgi:ADP-ribose pyrophosphatase